MTIEQLLGKSAKELAEMSTSQLEDYFRPFFPVTRPEHAARKKKDNEGDNLFTAKLYKKPTGPMSPADIEKMKRKQQAMEIAAKHGVNIKL